MNRVEEQIKLERLYVMGFKPERPSGKEPQNGSAFYDVGIRKNLKSFKALSFETIDADQ